jgi:hypothetical protein
MNERIKELAVQAMEYVYDVNGSPQHRLDTLYEKFAELIIMDCIAMCKTAVGTPDYNRGRMDCHDNIKEHFGIKK